jgi:hypothetical protein
MKLKMFNKDERSRRIKFNDKYGKGIVKQITPEIDRDQPDIEYSGKFASQTSLSESNKE